MVEVTTAARIQSLALEILHAAGVAEKEKKEKKKREKRMKKMNESGRGVEYAGRAQSSGCVCVCVLPEVETFEEGTALGRKI